jgi:ATP-dependent protease ClpP protease subunit
MVGVSAASDNGIIYHLLGGSLCQGVAIAQIIDFNVFDVVTICDVDFSVQFG